MSEEPGTGAEVAPYGSSSKPIANKIKPWQWPDLIQELATREQTRTALAVKYGVSQPAITQFAQRHVREIERVRENLSDEFAALWVAEKKRRVAVYQADIERIEEKSQKDASSVADAEIMRVKHSALKAVAEELGQLPARVNVTVSPVLHILEAVDPEALR